MQSPKPQCRIDPLSHAYPVNASFTSHHAYVHLNTAMHNHMYACVNDCVCVCVPANVSICVCVCVRKPSHHVALIFHAFSWQCQNFARSFCSCSFSLSLSGGAVSGPVKLPRAIVMLSSDFPRSLHTLY